MTEYLYDDIKRLLADIRFQVLRPAGSTVGYCARKCGKWARGCGVCADCLVEELRELPPELGYLPCLYLDACREQATIERRIMEIAEGNQS